MGHEIRPLYSDEDYAADAARHEPTDVIDFMSRWTLSWFVGLVAACIAYLVIGVLVGTGDNHTQQATMFGAMIVGSLVTAGFALVQTIVTWGRSDLATAAKWSLVVWAAICLLCALLAFLALLSVT